MPRSIFCSSCGQPISVADDLANQTILCPHCGIQMPPVHENLRPPAMRRVEPSEPVPTPFTIGELLSDSLNIGIKYWLPFLLMGLIVGGFMFISLIGFYCFTFALIFLVGSVQGQGDVNVSLSFIAAFVGIVLTVLLLFSLILVWLYGGQVAYSLAIVRGEQPPVSMLFSGLKYFWNILIAGANIMVIILCTVFVPLMLFWVPFFLWILSGAHHHQGLGVSIFLMTTLLLYFAMFIVSLFVQTIFCLTYCFIVDRQQGPVEAMKNSCRYVWTQFWRVLGSALLISVFAMIASAIPLVGMFIIIPIVLCCYTVLYLKITGQRHGLS